MLGAQNIRQQHIKIGLAGTRRWALFATDRIAVLSCSVMLWRERRRHRADLRRLISVGPHMIRDVGLAWEDAQREAAKPFWVL